MLPRTFVQARLDAVLARIEAYETALAAFAVEGTQSYTLDTGQDRQTVTRYDIPKMEEALQSLFDQYDVWYERLNPAPTVGRPIW